MPVAVTRMQARPDESLKPRLFQPMPGAPAGLQRRRRDAVSRLLLCC